MELGRLHHGDADRRAGVFPIERIRPGDELRCWVIGEMSLKPFLYGVETCLDWSRPAPGAD